ncbi:YdeI/OmpD-associated family protein [Sandaracinus amylolyticus]|nr:YdeI/OmpD-associated family protein [Sandaracinus amylolyticus]
MATKKTTKTASALDQLERLQPEDRAAWRAWLAKHHETSRGVWLVTYKKSSGKQTFDYEQAIEEALCFGWIDSKASKLDDERTMLLYTPRKPKSVWSKPNKERVARLLAAGRVEPRGLDAIELAKRTGAWDALNDSDALKVPDDLAARLDALPNARAHFEAFPKSTKHMILEWIRTAKKPETRAARIEQTATLAAKNLRAR